MKKAGFCAIFTFLAVLAFGQSENDFEIVQKDGGVTITGYTGTQTEIVIPSKISGLSVYTIGKGAFADKKLTKVALPAGLKIIDERAFADNKLTIVVIPNTVTAIANNAFSGNQITDLTLSNRLDFLGSGAFARNKIENLAIPTSLDFIRSGTFRGCPIKTLDLGGAKIISGISFDGAEIIQIKISANVDIDGMCGLDVSFVNFYKDGGKKAGIYVKNNRIWVMQ